MRSKSLQRRYFALIEFVAVVAIIVVLIAILLPALSKAMQLGKEIRQCKNNLRQCALSGLAYMGDWNASMSVYSYWSKILSDLEYIKNKNIVICPVQYPKSIPGLPPIIHIPLET